MRQLCFKNIALLNDSLVPTTINVLFYTLPIDVKFSTNASDKIRNERF